MRKYEDPPTGALFAQIAENWNEQVTKLFNWSINRLQTAAEKSNGGAAQTDYEMPSVQLCEYVRQDEYHEIQHEGSEGRQVSLSEGLASSDVGAGTTATTEARLN
jgi:hypothetical protein